MIGGRRGAARLVGISMSWEIVGILWLVPVMILVGSRVVARTLLRARVSRWDATDLLITAAHPDDCAIMGGELAQEALRAGRRVRILYLTCGADHEGHPRARVRREETIDVWRREGVGETDLTFVGLPHTVGRVPAVQVEDELRRAGEELSRLVRELAPGSTIVTCADGELHPDHRVMRSLTLRVVRDCGRKDLRVLEVPQYNEHASLVRTPNRAWLSILFEFPVVSRLVDKTRWPVAPSFVCGGAAGVLPSDPARLAKKLSMLRGFESEDGELLVRLFGYPDQFREVDAWIVRDSRADGMYWRSGKRPLGMSLVLFWMSMALATAGSALALGEMLASRASIDPWGFGLAVAAGLVFIGVAILIRRQGPERRLVLASTGVGFEFGALAASETAAMILPFLH